MRKLVFAVIASLVLGGAAFWLWPRDAVVEGATPGADGDRTVDLVRSSDALVGDGGVVQLSGVVLDEATGSPLPNVAVRLFVSDPEFETLECGVCHALAMHCDDAATTRQLFDAVKSGVITPPKVLAEVTSDEAGRFTFTDAPVGALVVAMRPGFMFAETSVVDGEDVVLSVRPIEGHRLHAVDPKSVPISGARFVLHEPLNGTTQTLRADAEGSVEVSSADPFAWVMAEADGALPIGRMLEDSSTFILAAPRTVIVKTFFSGEPIEADVFIELHGQQRTFKTSKGVARIEGLAYSYYLLSAQAGALVSAEQGADLESVETELRFELRPSSKLMVTVLSSSGEPVETVTGQLSGEGFSVSKTVENGAMLIFGPIVEGEADLYVSAEGKVDVRRTIDLKPGETQLEILMNDTTALKGSVVTADGKPAASVRIAVGENDEETEVAFSDENGEFSVELPYEGAFTVHAESPKLGSASVTVKVPGPKPVLTLQERGVLEVQMLEVDGTVVDPDCMLRAKSDSRLLWVEAKEENGWARLAGIEGGSYVLSRNMPGRLPIERDVEIVEGRTRRISVQLARGESIRGRVVDSKGRPAVAATVLVSAPTSDYGRTEDDGTFEIGGLVAQSTEIWAVGKDGVESPHVKLDIPARDLVLTIPEPMRVSGRVVDDKGNAIRKFDVNGTVFDGPDGRFEIDAPQRSLQITADGFEQEYLSEVSSDVGDVKLRSLVMLEGEVVDEQGRGVSGVLVQLSMDMMPTTTDGKGTFKLPLMPEVEQEIIATRGALSGRAPAKLGVRARVTLQQGTVVAGRVIGADGRGVRTSVTAFSRDFPRPMLFDTDVDGRFEGTMARGVWLFSARASRAQRTVDVSGARVEVVLGEAQGTCGLTVTADGMIENVWLMPTAPTEISEVMDVAERTPGTIQLSLGMSRREVTASGIPCGSWAVVAMISGEFVQTSVNLRGANESVVLPMPTPAPPEESASDAAP